MDGIFMNISLGPNVKFTCEMRQHFIRCNYLLAISFLAGRND